MHSTNEATGSPLVATETIDPTLSVNEVLRRYPLTGRVLNAYGVDTCCGGADSLEDAARAGSIDLADLLRALGTAIPTGER